MRTLTSAMSARLDLSHRAHHIKIEIDRTGSGSWVDLTSLHGFNWIVGATWTESIENPVASATVELRHKIHPLTLNPFQTSSPPNVGGVLCQSYRKLRIYTATVAPGVTPASGDYNLVFRGRIWKVSWQSESIQLECRDEGGDLMDLWIEQTRQYGSDSGVAVETVSQSILTDNSTGVTLWSANGTGGTPFAVADSPGWNIKPVYNQKEMSVMAALQRLWVDQLGFELRYKWQSTAGDFKLVATNPTRSSPSVNRTFTADQYTVSAIYTSNADVRNAVRVAYRDKGGLWQTTAAGTNSDSITKYGRKYMMIAEEATSQIDTSSEATDLRDNLLADLKEPTLFLDVEVQYFWPAEVNDYYTINANEVHFYAAQSLAVRSITHTFGTDGAKTSLGLSGAPKAGVRRLISRTQQSGYHTVGSGSFNPADQNVGYSGHNSSLNTYSNK